MRKPTDHGGTSWAWLVSSDDRPAGDSLDVALVWRDALRIFGPLIRRKGNFGDAAGSRWVWWGVLGFSMIFLWFPWIFLRVFFGFYDGLLWIFYVDGQFVQKSLCDLLRRFVSSLVGGLVFTDCTPKMVACMKVHQVHQ